MSRKYLALLACTILTYQNYGQEEDNDNDFQLQELDEVVVSDSRFELKRENSGKTVIKITPEDLELNPGKSLAEIINVQSGLEIAGSRGRFGEVLGVFARGGRGRQVLIIIDGVRVSDPSSFSHEYDLRLLSTSQVETIEIIKGAASTLYGTNAATAVINITTKSSSESKFALDLESSLGTNQTAADQNYNLGEFNNSARLGGTLNRLSYAVAFNHIFTDGISSIDTPDNEEDKTSKYSLDASIGYQFTDDISLRIYANQTKLDTEYDESFGLIDAPYRFVSEQKRVGLAGKWGYKNGELAINAAVSDYNSDNISAFPGSFKGKNYVTDLFAKYVFDNTFYTILGVNYIEDQAEFTEIEKFTLIDPYLNAVYVSDFGLNINGGLRLNNHSEYGSQLVYSINPSYVWQMNDSYLKLLGSFATSYITPSLTQLFGEFGANPDLEPETNRTIEGGLEYSYKGKLRANLVYFDRREENFVFFDNITFQYLNAENTIDANGVEIEADWNVISKLQFNANYTFTERKGDNAIRIPKHKLNAAALYDLSEKTKLSLTYSYTGKRSDTDFNTFSDTELDPYSLFGISVQHLFLPERLRVYLNVDNLFNVEFTEVIGFNTRGRNIRLGLAISL